MNILIIGSGGREHALAWRLSQSSHCEQLFVAPGNAGTAQLATNLPDMGDSFGEEDMKQISRFVQDTNIELLVIGPEAPLVRGLTDYLIQQHPGLAIIGPGKKGAQLEGSKDFAKSFMQKHGIPTAQSRSFTADSLQEGISYLKSKPLPIVLKADGLAAGKGVIICPTHEEAEQHLREMLVEAKFGEASRKVVIEDFLKGIELSVFVLTDGKNYLILPEAKDYKRIGEGDSGPNTGGMGAVSPVHFADEAFMQKVEQKIILPTVRGLQAEKIDYCGFIFIGLMNVNGEPYVIEYNVRMGDPETQAVLPRIENDLGELLLACARQQLTGKKIEISSKTAATVVMVSEGYPEAYEKGKEIIGLGESNPALVFHAGTRQQAGKVVTNGGRVLALTALDDDLSGALKKTYQGIQKLCWEGLYYRKDIGQDLMKS
ncbi:MAG: phosphoribosylamine--glycine ligase [Cyclobacteriaceae bacterium]